MANAQTKSFSKLTMNKLGRQLLEERLKEFHHDVMPVDLLPYLSCLTLEDKEEIHAENNNRGATRANQTLVDRLKRREDGLLQFIRALKKTKLWHVALLFDPRDEVNADDDGDLVNHDRKWIKIIGTAIDFRLSGDLHVHTADGPLYDLEEEIAKRFQDPKSQEAKQLRQAFREFLPRGTEFVHTEKGSIICTFRVSSVTAAEELWEMYTSGSFQQKLHELLIDQSFSKRIEEKEVTYSVTFPEERYTVIHQKLEEIEESQLVSGTSAMMSDAKEGDDFSDDFDGDFEIPPVFLENGNPLEPLELRLREYQFELAEKALEGHNTIICAPTNSGKTFVALHIVKQHLERYSEATSEAEIRKPNIIFIVSTVNLVQQQKHLFQQYLSAPYRVDDISGANSSDLPLKHVLRSHEVVVVTAQILVNALHASEDQRVGLGDISLLIFDECHHANKDHSYNKIMEQYMSLKMQPGKQVELPQVVGFTASLGVGKANKMEDAQNHILQVCANLDARGVSTVCKHVEELSRYVNKPARKIVSVNRSATDPFDRVINQVMSRLEDRAKKLQGKSYNAAPTGRSGQQYRQWVEELYKAAVSDANRFLVTYAEQLREYHIALEINNSTRMKDAMKRLEKYFRGLDDERMTTIDESLRSLYYRARSTLDKHVEKNGMPENGKLKKLKEFILENYPEDVRKDALEDKAEEEETGEEATEDKEEEETGEESTEDKEDTGKGATEEKEEEETGEEATEEKEEEEETGKEATEKDGEETGKKVAEIVEAEIEDPEDENGDESKEENLEERFRDKEEEGEVEENEKNSTENKAKGIVFTRTRESTEALLDWINESEEFRDILKPQKLVGSGDVRIGMTQRSQECAIEKFKNGACNILLATTVAEEGLDISDCNYVIRYDMMGNEISSVQSRGRVRADEGKYTVLVASDSGALKRESKNQFREILMEEAVARVQRIDPAEFVKKVQDLQRKACQNRLFKRDLCRAHKSQFEPDGVTFYCRKCNIPACQAHQLRRFQKSFHVVIDHEFQSKVTLKPKSNPKTQDGVTMTKAIHCAKCNDYWGVTAMIHCGEWMCLKVSRFAVQLKADSNLLSMFKKWKDVPFPVPEVSLDELLATSDEEDPALTDDFDMD